MTDFPKSVFLVVLSMSVTGCLHEMRSQVKLDTQKEISKEEKQELVKLATTKKKFGRVVINEKKFDKDSGKLVDDKTITKFPSVTVGTLASNASGTTDTKEKEASKIEAKNESLWKLMTFGDWIGLAVAGAAIVGIAIWTFFKGVKK